MSSAPVGDAALDAAVDGELLPPDALPSPALPDPGSKSLVRAAPAGGTSWEVRRWYDEAAEADIPVHDGTLATARLAADAYARRAKAANTRRAYRAGVRAWCEWCDTHALPSLPARAEDVAAFLADERLRGRAVNTVELRRAAIRSLHFLAGLPVPTAEARVGAAVAGMQREAAERGELPRKKQAATVQVLREILAAMPDDLAGLRDRALLLHRAVAAMRQLPACLVERRGVWWVEPDLWGVGQAIADDVLAVAALIARRHGYPTAYGLGPAFQNLIAQWRPHLLDEAG